MSWELNEHGTARFGEDGKLGAAYENGKGKVILQDCGSIIASTALAEQASNPTREEGDFILRDFRMLSAVLIEGYWLDLTKPGVLKKALPLFGNVTIFRDHWPTVEDWVGVAINPKWTNSVGVEGIDATYRIDKIQAPGIARGINQTPPAIHSTSVELRFKFEKSHPDLSGWDFWDNLGRNIDGEIVRMIVTEIMRIPEVSLVYAGADPNAKSLSLSSIKQPNKENRVMNEEEKKELAALKAKSEEQSSKLAVLEKENSEMKGQLEIYQKAEDEKLEVDRKEALRLYKLSAGDNAKAGMEKLIQNAKGEELKTLTEDFRSDVEKLHPVRCAKCGSHEISRASSEGSDPKGLKSAPEPGIPVSEIPR